VEQVHSIGQANGEVAATIVVKISSGTAESGVGKFKAGAVGDIFKMAVTEVVQEMAATADCDADEK
jgi:hypothetical protein